MKFSHIGETLHILIYSVPAWYTNEIVTEKLALSFLIPIALLLVIYGLEVQALTWEEENKRKENLGL